MSSQALKSLHSAIEKANASNNFKKNGIVATIQENSIDRKVEILINGKVVMSAKAKNMSDAHTDIIKWLCIAGLPIFNDMHIFVEDGDIKILTKED